MLSYENKLFHFDPDSLLDNSRVRRADFSFNKETNTWVTPFPHKAKKVCSKSDLGLVNAVQEMMDDKAVLSNALYSDLHVPTPEGLQLKPFQRAGVEFMLSNEHTLIADDMRLGKTIEAIGFCNIVKPKTVLIVCPATVKINWRREWLKWSTQELSIGILKPKDKALNTNVVIVNFDILVKLEIVLKAVEWDVFIIDEVHRIKSDSAKRSNVVYGKFKDNKTKKWNDPLRRAPINAKRILALTGTPIPNKPIELYLLLKYLLSQGFPRR